MEDPNSIGGGGSGDASGDAAAVADANSMAYAAAEAAAAAAAAEAQDDLSARTCRICNKGGEDGRAMIHFPPIEEVDVTVSQVAPEVTTFSEDVVMHVFCGKTASILPNVNMPQYEILSKAGLKNKHGIGTEVNTALARTRCATVAQPGVKEKQFYIVQEFEANLTAVRMATGTHHVYQQQSQSPEISIPPHPHHMYAQPPLEQQQQQQQPQYATHATDASVASLSPQPQPPHYQSPPQQPLKPAPVKAAAGTTLLKPGSRAARKEEAWAYAPPSSSSQEMTTADGKIKCPCGGTHLPTGTPKGAASWRSHVMTKRHQRWMQDNELLNAV